MCDETFLAMDENDVLKFVVSDDSDISVIRQFLIHHTSFKGTIYVSPCFGKISLEHLVTEVKLLQLKFPKFDIRFQVQLHKIVYPVDMRGV